MFFVKLDVTKLTDSEFQTLEDLVKSERIQRTGAADLSLSEKCLVKCGQQIAAIKAYRDRTGSGLRDAKDACDAFRNAMPGFSQGMTYNETRNCWEWPTGR